MPASEKAPFVYRIIYAIARVITRLLTRRHFSGEEHVPRSGAVLFVANHISNYDTLTLGEFVISSGRWPRFLGKSEIWKVPVLGWLATKARQIPVERSTERAKDSLVHAREALLEGGAVAIYPEGTITRDPEGWPMRSRHGAARLALATGAQVVPVAQLGAEQLLGGSRIEPRKLLSLRRRDVYVTAGAPVDLAGLPLTDEPTREHLEEATSRMTGAVSELYAALRGEPVPDLIWDPWLKTYVTRPAARRSG